MKKFIISAALLLPLLSAVSCSMFELDNYDGPNAQVSGKLLDVVTGEKVGLEAGTAQTFDWSTWSMVTAVNYGSLVVSEQGFISPNYTGDPAKNMIITVTDKKLLQKTGGIIQGMSGSPIIQSGKFVGAVTHVFVNNPVSGYAIFAENMLSRENQ